MITGINRIFTTRLPNTKKLTIITESTNRFSKIEVSEGTKNIVILSIVGLIVKSGNERKLRKAKSIATAKKNEIMTSFLFDFVKGIKLIFLLINFNLLRSL